jgi:hypothetical protein
MLLLWEDIRYSLRILARSRGFTAVSLISLSLGICIATCADSEMNGIILRNIPATTKPDQLVGTQTPISYPYYKRYRELRGLFSSTLAYAAPVPLDVSLEGRRERTWAHLVTPSYFSTLGVRPVLGRAFDQQEERPAQEPVVIVSYRFWQGVLGGDPAAVGRTLHVNGVPANIIGVGPKDFLGASPAFYVADLWMPVTAAERVAPELAGDALERHDLKMFQFVGRLKPSVTMAQAESELDVVTRQMEKAFGDESRPDSEPRVLLVVTVFTGVFFWFRPALRATRVVLTPALKEGGNIPLRRHRRLSLRNILLVSQLAGSLMLLLIVGLLSLGIQTTMGIAEGFNPRNLYLISVDPVRDGYSSEQAVTFLQKLLERVQRMPSITSVSLTESLPVLIDGHLGVTFSTTGAYQQETDVVHWARKSMVGKDYFETTGIPILMGRGFRKEDETDDSRVVVVSQRLVQDVWKTLSAVALR